MRATSRSRANPDSGIRRRPADSWSDIPYTSASNRATCSGIPTCRSTHARQNANPSLHWEIGRIMGRTATESPASCPRGASVLAFDVYVYRLQACLFQYGRTGWRLRVMEDGTTDYRISQISPTVGTDRPPSPRLWRARRAVRCARRAQRSRPNACVRRSRNTWRGFIRSVAASVSPSTSLGAGKWMSFPLVHTRSYARVLGYSISQTARTVPGLRYLTYGCD